MTPAQAALLKKRWAAKREALLKSPRYQAARAVFATPAGKQLLAELRDVFDPDDITGDSAEETYFHLGGRALYRELAHLATAGQTERTGE